MLVINPGECIDCGVCEPECPANAIVPDTAAGSEKWVALNARLSVLLPNISEKRDPPNDADEWKGVEGKLKFLSEAFGASSS